MKNYIINVILASIVMLAGSCNKAESDKAIQLLALPQHCESSFIGNNKDNDDNSWIAGTLLAVRYTGCTDFQVNNISVKLEGATNFVAGIYNEVDGKPGNLYRQTSVVSGIAGWNTGFFGAGELNIIAGDKYWLVVVAESAGVRDRDNVGSCKVKTVNWADYSGGMPNLNSETWDSNFKSEIKIYAY